MNWDQIQEHKPPPNPAKETDSRFADYESKYGQESWELDALSTDVIQILVVENVLSVRNRAAWEAAVKVEERNRAVLYELVDD